MPRYYFHVRMTAGSVLRDRVGIEFRDLAAARTDAEEAVRQTIIEKKAAGQPIEMDSLQITDRAGRTLAVVDAIRPIGKRRALTFGSETSVISCAWNAQLLRRLALVWRPASIVATTI